MAIILCGKTVSNHIREGIKVKAENIEKQRGSKPKLGIVQGGDRPDSNQYVNNKKRAADNNNIEHFHERVFDNNGIEYIENLIATARDLNSKCDGVIIQVPIPGLSQKEQDLVISSLDSRVDVDGMTKQVEGEFYTNSRTHNLTAPCTPKGIMSILSYYKIPLEGKKVVIIGRSDIVGRPLAHLMMKADATVTVCHSYTLLDDIYDYVKNADVVVCAIGKPEFINSWDFQGIDWSEKVLIDVGTNRVGDEWYGDIQQKIKDRSYAYTPVPGGVGPMTITSLLQKLVDRIDTN